MQSRFDEQPGRAWEAGSAEESAVANEERTALLLAVDALRDDDRAVLAYRYLFDMSEAEMAQALQCAPGTVKSRLSRSLARLREHLTRVAPLGIVPGDFGAWLAHGFRDAVQPAVPPEFATVILERIVTAGAAGAAAAAGSSRPSTQQLVTMVGGGGAIVAAVAALGLLLSTQRMPEPVPIQQPTQVVQAVQPSVQAVQPTPSITLVGAAAPPPAGFVMYGGDLTDAQHDELRQLFGSNANGLPTETVSRAELVNTLQSAGLPVDGSERAITSIVVNCQMPGTGVHIQTVNITDSRGRVRQCARRGGRRRCLRDGGCAFEHPDDWRDRAAGRTARVPTLSWWWWPSSTAVAPGEQLHLTGELAALGGGWERAAAMMLRATHAATLAPANDETSIGGAVDDAAAQEGLTGGVQGRRFDTRQDRLAMALLLVLIRRRLRARGSQKSADLRWLTALGTG